jgi:hypothetical protein
MELEWFSYRRALNRERAQKRTHFYQISQRLFSSGLRDNSRHFESLEWLSSILRSKDDGSREGQSSQIVPRVMKGMLIWQEHVAVGPVESEKTHIGKTHRLQECNTNLHEVSKIAGKSGGHVPLSQIKGEIRATFPGHSALAMLRALEVSKSRGEFWGIDNSQWWNTTPALKTVKEFRDLCTGSGQIRLLHFRQGV